MLLGEKEIIEKAIEKNGKPMQLVVAMEECAELIKELSKHIRGEFNVYHIAEETADVLIMIDQLKVIFERYEFSDLVQEQRRKKLLRLAHRLEDCE